MGQKAAPRWMRCLKKVPSLKETPSENSTINVITLLVQQSLTIDPYCTDLALSAYVLTYFTSEALQF